MKKQLFCGLFLLAPAMVSLNARLAQGQTVPNPPVPGQAVPGQAGQAVPVQAPGQAVPGQIPGQPVPGKTVPGQSVPGQPVNGTPVPGGAVPGKTDPTQTIAGQTGGQPFPSSTVFGTGYGSSLGNGFYGQGYSGYYGQGLPYNQPYTSMSNQWYTSPTNQGSMFSNYNSAYAGYTSPYGRGISSGAGYGANAGYGIAAASLGAYSAMSGGGTAAETPDGADATGMGNLVRSMGVYNELTAKAAGDYETARGQFAENQHRIHEERLFRKRENQAIVAQDRDSARAARERQQEFIAAHRPPPLSSDLLDTYTGHIEWPVALKSTEFDELRSQLESLFESKFKSGATSETTSLLLSTIGELQDQLRGEVLTLPLHEYTEGRRFLERLLASAKQ